MKFRDNVMNPELSGIHRASNGRPFIIVEGGPGRTPPLMPDLEHDETEAERDAEDEELWDIEDRMEE